MLNNIRKPYSQIRLIKKSVVSITPWHGNWFFSKHLWKTLSGKTHFLPLFIEIPFLRKNLFSHLCHHGYFTLFARGHVIINFILYLIS